MQPAAFVSRKINHCIKPTVPSIYHCHPRRTDPRRQWAASSASPSPGREAQAELCWWAAPAGWIHRGPHKLHAARGLGALSLLFIIIFIFFFNAQSCPQIEIVSSRCCSRTLSLLFPTRYLNFSGGWRLIDVSISFYSTSVKSKLPSQSCCRGSLSSKAAEQPSQGGEMVGGGQGWQAASDQLVRLVFKTSQCFSSCGPASLFLFLRLFVPVLHQQQHQGSER